MTDKEVFDNFLAANPPRAAVWNWNGTATTVSARTEQRAYADAWAAIPDGEFKYLKAIELTKKGAVLALPMDEWNLRQVQPMGQYGVLSPVGPANIYIPEMEHSARMAIAEGEYSEALIAAYNGGKNLGAIFAKAFADYEREGARRGQFTQTEAQRIIAVWQERHKPNTFEKVMKVVVPAFIIIVAAVAVAGVIAAEGAAAAGTAEAGTLEAATVTAGAGATVTTGTSATVAAGTGATVTAGTGTTLAGALAVVQQAGQAVGVVAGVVGAVDGGGNDGPMTAQAAPVATQAAAKNNAPAAIAVGLVGLLVSIFL